jgi:hypothetical protein
MLESLRIALRKQKKPVFEDAPGRIAGSVDLFILPVIGLCQDGSALEFPQFLNNCPRIFRYSIG